MIHTRDADFTLICADVLDGLRSLEDGSVHCVVTSPPYWGLRDYSACGCVAEGRLEVFEDGRGDRHTAGGAIAFHRQGQPKPDCSECQGTGKRVGVSTLQLGLEATPDLYVARIVEVFREVRRVLRADGTCWVNLGDTYNAGTGGRQPSRDVSVAGDVGYWQKAGEMGDRRIDWPGLKIKDLCGMPWRVAFALQADGWYLRSDIIWSKPNPMPESVTDRPTKAHEYVFLLSKEARYFFDQEAVREPQSPDGRHVTTVLGGNGSIQHRDGERWPNPTGRNVRSVWDIATQPYPEAHFATYPEELVRRCVLAGTSERGCCAVCGKPWEREVERSTIEDVGRSEHAKRFNNQDRNDNKRLLGRAYQRAMNASPPRALGWRPGCRCDSRHTEGTGVFYPYEPIPCTVLDPFLGSGTTAFVARKHGRRSIGIELNPAYCDLAARRMQQQSLLV